MLDFLLISYLGGYKTDPDELVMPFCYTHGHAGCTSDAGHASDDGRTSHAGY